MDVARPNPIVSRVRRAFLPRSDLAWGEFGARVQELGSSADIVHLVEIDTAWCGRELAVPKVLQIEYLVRRDQPFGAPWTRQFRNVAELVQAEKRALRHHHYVTANSSSVAADLERMKPERTVVRVVPLGLIPTSYEQSSLDGPPVAGIIGTAEWPPTMASIRRLVTRIWPLVLREVPDARLLIAGRGTGQLDDLRGVSNVELLGTVPSASSFLGELSVLIHPLDHGSGMKVKVLEAMACGLPVVTTAAGAEGIVPCDGVRLCENDEAIADAAISILRDPEERAARGRANRAAFVEHYTPSIVTRPLVALYESILGA